MSKALEKVNALVDFLVENVKETLVTDPVEGAIVHLIKSVLPMPTFVEPTKDSEDQRTKLEKEQQEVRDRLKHVLLRCHPSQFNTDELKCKKATEITASLTSFKDSLFSQIFDLSKMPAGGRSAARKRNLFCSHVFRRAAMTPVVISGFDVLESEAAQRQIEEHNLTLALFKEARKQAFAGIDGLIRAGTQLKAKVAENKADAKQNMVMVVWKGQEAKDALSKMDTQLFADTEDLQNIFENTQSLMNGMEEDIKADLDKRNEQLHSGNDDIFPDDFFQTKSWRISWMLLPPTPCQATVFLTETTSNGCVSFNFGGTCQYLSKAMMTIFVALGLELRHLLISLAM